MLARRRRRIPENARVGGSVSVALTAAPESLDPAVATSREAVQTLWLVHTPMLTYARTEGAGGTKLIPALAEEMPEVSEDRRTLTMTVRRGLRYSDGQRVGAGDLERAIKRAVRLNVKGLDLFGRIDGARRFARESLTEDDITGITADTRTRQVRIDLTRPDPSLPYALATPMAAPVPPGIPMADQTRDPPPGVGPYRSAPARPGTVFVLERRRRLSPARGARRSGRRAGRRVVR